MEEIIAAPTVDGIVAAACFNEIVAPLSINLVITPPPNHPDVIERVVNEGAGPWIIARETGRQFRQQPRIKRAKWREFRHFEQAQRRFHPRIEINRPGMYHVSGVRP